MDLKQYILESLSKFKMTDEDKKKLINLDQRHNELTLKVRNEFNEKDIHNLDDEMNMFFEKRKNGEKYFPVFDLGKCKYDNQLINDLNQLKLEFERFPQCYLSKYYIECINRHIKWVDFQIRRHNGEEIIWNDEFPDFNTYQKALDAFNSNEYISTKDLDRNIDAEGATKQIESTLKELGYPWKVSIEPDMLARMNVLPDGIIRICKTAKFNEADIEGLIAHEIKGHIGRRYYGKQTGLYLFLHGLKRRNLLDEGLAVWNSLNLVKHDKPNVMVSISLKYIICYNKYKMDFCELFDFIKDLCKNHNISDKVIFKAIARSKREMLDASISGGVIDDGDYFKGYNMVNDMTDQERDDILKWNIGVDQLRDLNNIKEFFEVNHFEPLK